MCRREYDCSTSEVSMSTINVTQSATRILPILDSHPHPIVNVVKHLTALGHRHGRALLCPSGLTSLARCIEIFGLSFARRSFVPKTRRIAITASTLKKTAQLWAGSCMDSLADTLRAFIAENHDETYDADKADKHTGHHR